MDSNMHPGSLDMLHLYMLDHMITHNMNAAAYAFIGEAGLVDFILGFTFPDGLLAEWWSLFWEYYNVRTYGRSSVGVTVPEFFARAETRVQAQAQTEARPQAQAEARDQAQAQAEYQAQVHAEAHALALEQAHFQAQAAAEAQAHAWTLAHNGMGFYNPFDYVMSQTAMHTFPFFGYTDEMMSQLDPSWSDDQSDDGWVGPEHSSYHPR